MDLLEQYFPHLSYEQIEQFSQLNILFKNLNTKINLVSRKDIDFLFERHIIHSLGIAKFQKFKNKTEILDVGTGGGFPVIPLSIVFPNVKFYLIDSISKKIDAVIKITKALGLKNIIALNVRAEEYNQDVDFVGAAPAFNLIPSPPGLAEPLPFAFIYDLATKTKQFNQEIRIGDLESDGLRWAVGGLFWKENVDQQNNNLISLMFGLPGFIPSAAQNISAITIPPPSDEFRDTDHVSVYGILEYDISDQFSASLEAR